MSIARSRIVVAAFLLLCWTASSTAVPAQEVIIDTYQQSGTFKIITTQEVPATQPVQQPAQPAEQPPGQEGEAKPGETPETKPEGDQAKKEDEPKVIKRPTEPPPDADPKELEVVPVDGMVGFQFRGQAWPDVIDWLGRISNMSVDWQELPADYLNVSTQRLYTVAEARDLINWHLLARGFTLLEHDGFLSVAKTETLSAGRVPRVSVSQLDTLLPHTYVRVMFPLDWMVAEDAAEELQPLLSKNGKLHPLRHTNRLDVVDAVVNVRQVRDVLAEEQSIESQERLVQEFVLAHVRADDVAQQLREFLGLESSSAPAGPMSPEQMQMMQQQMAMQAQMQAQMQQQQPGGRPKREEEPVRILVNRIKNSVMVNAPPDKMALVAETVQLLDVAANAPESLQSYLSRMQVHHVTQLDPAKLVASLKELGGLEPATRLEVDTQNRAIIAYASPADHFLIQSLIQRLDSGARKVAVVQLRRLEADQVAGTIEYLFTRSDSDDSSDRGYYDPWMGLIMGGRSRRQQAPDEFRVDADILNNRLIVKANDVELAAVIDLLEQLGEIPGRGGDGTVRVLDVAPGRETEAFLRALQQRWQHISPNPLVLPPGLTPGEPGEPESREDAETDAETDAEAEAASPSSTPASSNKVTQERPIHRDREPAPRDSIVQFAQFTPIDDAERQRPAPGQSPVLINVDAEGRLVISSQDGLALDLLEQLIQQTAPAPKNFEIFKLKNAPAWWVVLNLEDFYKDEEQGENRQDRMMRMMWGIPSQQRQERSRLSANKAPRFISDTDTNTIVVKNATAPQLETIAELIELYDVPEPDDTRTARVTKLIPVKYSRASIIAETVKDAYRDLLSDNDKALAQQQQQQNPQEPRQATGTTYITNFGGEEEPPPREQRTEARFKGKLSIGVDDLTNSLLISTEGDNLMRVVSDMVAALDKAAVGVNEVQVISVPGGMHGGLLQDTITRVLQQQQSGTPEPASNQPVAPQPVMVTPVQASPPVQIDYSGGF